MGSLKALQEWCRLQCEDYNDVDVKNMSTSFRDGLAFCAIIHRFRPDLIDFSSLSKENVYENNRLAFEVAEAQLGIPALLDPEDMVSMNVPDRLSVITYVSQYYNFFTNKSHVNPPTTKRPAGSGQGEPAQKRLMAPLEDKAPGPEPALTGSGEADPLVGRGGTLSSTCTACHKHVHLVQRFLVEGRLYHRHCFRCRECSSTLLPGSYKIGKEAGSLVCTHHFARPALANQNGRPDLSARPVEAQSTRIGRSPSHQAPTSESERETTPPPPAVAAVAQNALTSNSLLAEDTPTPAGQSDSLIIEEEPSVPPNPFGESDDDEGGEEEEEAVTKEEEKEEIPTPANDPPPEARQADTPPAPSATPGGVTRPVPAPRRVPEATPPPRPAPRARPHHTPDRQEPVAGVRQKPLLPPKPRERAHSPGSQSNDTPKSKDPPWLALVQSEPKKKPAPPPPPAGLATPPRAGSLSSLRAEGSRPCTPPPPPANPFDDDDDEEVDDDEGHGGEEEGGAVPTPAGVAASHPWYRITQAAEAGGAETTPPSGGSSSRSSSPGGGGGRGRKRPAPRAPQATSADPVPPYSLPSSRSPSPARSVESLSSGPPDHPVTKSASEPSICAPPAAAACPPEPRLSLSPSPPPNVPANTSSAPATPQTNRSEGGRGPRHPPPRPPTSATTPSLLAPETPTANGKRTCKENPFNRKPSPSHGSAKARPPHGPRPARPPAPGHGFPLIKRKVQSDQYVPPEDIHGEMKQLEEELDRLEQRGVELESKLRDNPNDDEEEQLLVEWFTLIHDKHLLVRREAELVYTSKQQGLEERQGDVEYELRCLLNKPEKDWSEADRSREQDLMADLVTIIEQRNHIINSMDQDRQRDEEEDKLMAAMLKKKDFHKETDGAEEKEKKKKKAKFKPMKVLKRLSHKGEPSNKTPSPRKDKS